MKFISSALVTTLVIKSVLGDVPTKEMFEATTLEQFREANEAWKPTTKTIRRRATEEVSYPKIAADFGGLPGFYHGVASGDPLPDAIILWTRYTPESDSDVVELEYRIAEYDPAIQLDDHLDPSKNMKKMIVGREFVDASTDFTLKLDVTGLEPLKEYVYAFTDGSVVSQVGKTKTAPGDKNVESLIYATFSCAHFSNGYFHAYDIASTIKDLDFWVHVGDYIYEYGGYGNYATASAERRAQTDPWWEIVDLQDYRNRFAQYHTDEALQSLHRAAPMIAQWDDHELTNNAYGLGVEGTLGAENHQPSCSANPDSTDAEKNTAKCDRDEGNATIRFNNAVRAYMEWLPIRAAPGDLGVVALSNVRTIEWGSIADFVVVDTRISQRSKNPALASVFGQFGFAYVDADYENYATNPTYQGIANTTLNEQYNPEYTMIGNHKEYLRGQFEKSKAAGKPFQVFVAATMMGPQVPLNPSKMYQLVPPEAQEIIKASLDSILASGSGGFFRAMTAMEELRVPWNADGYDGYSHERAELLDMFKTAANNVIVLAGDLHDSWAWTLYEGVS